jgi:oxidase EvaA
MSLGEDFLASAERLPERPATPDPEGFLRGRATTYACDVREVPLGALARWRLGDDLAHDTRRFFTVEGVAVETNFGRTPRWTQPILMQPEIGLLGFLAKRIEGTLHLLAQAKMEPGNQVPVQFSPTVQATPSNYTRVHGGRPTPYLDRFLGPARGRVLVDQLQSEQGSRYYRKRNRNMIVEVPEDEDLPLERDFAWLTLGQLRGLLARGSRVNMNARTVLSCIAYAGAAPLSDAILASHLAGCTAEELQEALSWLADVKTAFHLDTRRIRLGALTDWIADEQSIRHVRGRFFRVIGVSVSAGNREVDAWAQPMIAPTRQATVAFLCQRRAGVLQLLVQARVEPGFIDRVELGPTVQFAPHDEIRREELPPLAEYLDAPAGWVRFSAVQSEDGGRFYHQQTIHRVIELPENEPLDVPPGYRWMSLALLKRLMRRGYTVDIEARSSMACLG